MHSRTSCLAALSPGRQKDTQHKMISACSAAPELSLTAPGRALQVISGSSAMPTATVQLRGPDGIDRVATGMGTGPVDAAFKAIDELVRVQVRI